MFEPSAATPVAVLPEPVVLEESESPPVAVLLDPAVSAWSALNPNAESPNPLVTLVSAPSPNAVLFCADAAPTRDKISKPVDVRHKRASTTLFIVISP